MAGFPDIAHSKGSFINRCCPTDCRGGGRTDFNHTTSRVEFLVERFLGNSIAYTGIYRFKGLVITQQRATGGIAGNIDRLVIEGICEGCRELDPVLGSFLGAFNHKIVGAGGQAATSLIDNDLLTHAEQRIG